MPSPVMRPVALCLLCMDEGATVSLHCVAPRPIAVGARCLERLVKREWVWIPLTGREVRDDSPEPTSDAAAPPPASRGT